MTEMNVNGPISRRALFGGIAGGLALTALPTFIVSPARAAGVDSLGELIFDAIGIVTSSIGLIEDQSRGTKIKNLAELSTNLVNKQNFILEKIKDLNVVFQGEIERAFRDDILRELSAEITDFNIMVSGGTLVSNSNTMNKERRVERLHDMIAEYGTPAFTAFCACTAMLHSLYAINGNNPRQYRALYNSEANILNGWLADESEGSVIAARTALDNIFAQDDVFKKATEEKGIKLAEIVRISRGWVYAAAYGIVFKQHADGSHGLFYGQTEVSEFRVTSENGQSDRYRLPVDNDGEAFKIYFDLVPEEFKKVYPFLGEARDIEYFNAEIVLQKEYIPEMITRINAQYEELYNNRSHYEKRLNDVNMLENAMNKVAKKLTAAAAKISLAAPSPPGP